nr:hypothetical protein [Candidatus Sigynarchaeum springense]
MGVGERKEEAIPFLTWIKGLLGKDPEYVTFDFDDTWELSVKIVFPDSIIIICTFHVTQLLTRGLLKEFNRLQKENNTSFIKECTIARKISLAIDHGETMAAMPVFKQFFCAEWFKFYNHIVAICTLDDAGSFTNSYMALLVAMKSWNPTAAALFEKNLAPKWPKQGFTMKGMKNFKSELKKKWRVVLRDIRGDREEKKHEFAKVKYLLLKKPVNLEQWETELLIPFLRDNTWARSYRDTLLQFYTMLDDPPSENPSLEFLDKLVCKESHKDLKSAVNTLKAKKEYVFNFVKAWKAHPKWKSIRAFKVSPEPTMKKINAISRTQYGFRLDESARYKLEQHLKCPVMVSQSVLKDNGVDRP